MITTECPWCAEPAQVEGTAHVELTCSNCGIAVEVAPDPIPDRLDRAA